MPKLNFPWVRPALLCGLCLLLAPWRQASGPLDETAKGTHRKSAAAPDTISKAASKVQAADPPAAVAKTRVNVFAEFNQWLEKYRAAAPPEKAVLVAVGGELARRRFEALSRLIETHPAQALQEAVPMRARQEWPDTFRDWLEERVSVRADYLVRATLATGTNAGVVIDRFVANSDRTYRAFVYGRRLQQTSKASIPLHGIAIGDKLAVHESPIRPLEVGEVPNPAWSLGNAAGQCPVSQRAADVALAAESGGEVFYFCQGGHIEAFGRTLEAQESGVGPDATDLAASGSSWTLGNKSLLYMRVNFPDDSTEPITFSETTNLMNVVNGFFIENSYSTLSLTTTVTPLLTLPRSKSWYQTNNNSYALLSEARVLAAAAGYDTVNYDLDCVHNVPIFPFGGAAYVGLKGAWIQESTHRVVSHELGHNFGLWHANFWQTTDGTSIGSGSNLEYGNIFDTMGSGNTPQNHFGAYEKYILNWLPVAAVQTVTVNGTYRLHPFDIPALTGGLRYALKIRKDGQRDYWVELRQRLTGYPSLQNGVLLNWSPWSESNGGAQLLDTTPGSPGGLNDAALAIGQTFTDPGAGIQITPVQFGGTTPQSIDVQVSFVTFSNILLEAESGALTPNMTVYGDALASGGQFIASPTSSGTATYSVNVATAGSYIIWARVLAPSSSQDSFHVSMDGGSEDIYDVAEGIWSSEWQWTCVNGRAGGNPLTLNPRLFPLSIGAHTLRFRARDANTKLDRLILTTDPNFTPLAPNTPPVISAIPDLAVAQNSSSGPIPFTVGDAESPASALTVSATSYDTTLLPNESIVFGGYSSNRTVTVTPAANRIGSTTVRITVTDPSGVAATEYFSLTVRGSIQLAINAATPGDSFFIPSGVYVENLFIDKDITLFGNSYGIGSTIIDGGGTGSTLVVQSNVTVRLYGVTLQNGLSYTGGGLRNFGKVTLTGCVVSSNRIDGWQGAGIYNQGVLDVIYSTIQGNGSATSSFQSGGGIYNAGGAVTLMGSHVLGNRAEFAAGIHNDSGHLDVSYSQISSNFAGADAAICNEGMATVSDSTIEGNAARTALGAIGNRGAMALLRTSVRGNTGDGAGGIFNSGDLTIDDCALHGNRAYEGEGGALANSGSATLRNTTISSNSTIVFSPQGGPGGGLFNYYGTLALFNCTVSGNHAGGVNEYAPGHGGGVYNEGGLVTLNNCTVTANSGERAGGGLFNTNGTMRLFSTIVASNDAGYFAISPDAYGPLDSRGYNLIRNTNGVVLNGILTGNILGQDPLLGPLQDNGGRTLTHALRPGSPAIDKGNSGGRLTDQRGFDRPHDFASIANAAEGSDIGAVEFDYDYFSFEAEYGVLSAPMTYGSDPAAHFGGYIYSPETNGSATYTFSITNAGQYVVWCRVLAPSFLSNSFFVSVNGGPEDIYDVAQDHWSPAWQWDALNGRNSGGPTVARVFNLVGGLNTLRFRAREAYTKLDRFFITSDRGFIPGYIQQQIDAAAPGQTINISGGVFVENIVLNKSLTLQGAGRLLTFVDGGSSGSVFTIGNNATVTLRGLTVRHGLEFYGSGINNLATLTVENCAVTRNKSYGYGTGIYNEGVLQLSNCTVSANSEGYGGSLYNAAGGTVALFGSLVSDNGPIENVAGIDNHGQMTLDASTVSGNTTPGGVGGIRNSGSLVLRNSTISGNQNTTDSSCPGIENGGSLTMLNCTVSGNTASGFNSFGQGGGIDNFGSLTMTHCTVASNHSIIGAGGIDNSGSINLRNCLIAGNSASSSLSADVRGQFYSDGFNLIRNIEGASIYGFTFYDIIGQDPLLGPLQDNGGPTLTHALLPGSPAIDHGYANGINADQRGFVRPADIPGINNVADGSDIGAFEFTPVVPVISLHPRNQFVAFGSNAVFTMVAAGVPPLVYQWQRHGTNLPNGGKVSGANTATLILSNAQVEDATDYRVIVSNASGSAISDSAMLTVEGYIQALVDTASPGGFVYLAEGNYSESVVIDKNLYVYGGNLARVSGTLGRAAFTVGPTAKVTLAYIALANGDGGLRNTGETDLYYCSISNNTSFAGAGILNSGQLSLRSCTLSGNFSYGSGGACYNASNATLTLDHCTLSNNVAFTSGGGIYNRGTLLVKESSLVKNATDTFGGEGAGLANLGVATIRDSTISSNTTFVGGAVKNSGSLTLLNCTLAGNYGDFSGGGLANYGQAWLTNCTLSGNLADSTESTMGDGGGILNAGGALYLASCTVSSNRASGSPGAPRNGGGIANLSGSVTLHNTLVAGNSASAGTGPDLFGAITSAGFNFVQNTSGAALTGVVSNNVTGQNARLGPLQDNGGLTFTHALASNSPAIDKGNAGGQFKDQRGVYRQDLAGFPNSSDGSDIGAYEFAYTYQTLQAIYAELSPPMTTDYDYQNNNWFIYSTVSSNGTARFNVTVPESGAYVIWARLIATDETANSFIVSANGGPEDTFDAGRLTGFSTNWQWNAVNGRGGNPTTTTLNPRLFTLNRGTNTILFRGREPNTKLERILVTNDRSLVPGSLQQLVNAAAPGATINVSTPGTYIENVIIDKNLNIKGAGRLATLVDGSRSGSVFLVRSNATVTLRDLTILNGNNYQGAGLVNFGVTTLSNATVSGHSADSIGNYGTLTVLASTISETFGNHFSGGIWNNGILICKDSIFRALQGNAIYGYGGRMALTNCSISENSYSIDVSVSSNATFHACAIFANGGNGISVYGTALLQNCTISGNAGSGVQVWSESSVEINQCTIYGNRGEYGGGGGVQSYGLTTLRGAIVAGNSASAGFGPDCSGTITSLGYNLIQNPTGFDLLGDNTGNIFNASPLLGPLQNNGGPTFTHLLLAGSPAINAGPTTGYPLVDQRGALRPTDGNGDCRIVADIGAVELDAFLLSRVCTLELLPGRDVRLHFHGVAGRSYRIETSPTIAPATWTTIGTATANAVGQFDFDDTRAHNFTRRFYRVREL